MVLYPILLCQAWSTTVPNFMLVSGIAQSGQNLALSRLAIVRLGETVQVSSLQLTKVKPVLSGHTKIDKTRVLKTNGSLMKVVSIAECSLGAFCNTFDLREVIIDLEPKFFVFLE